MTSDDFEERIAGVASLAEPQRRRCTGSSSIGATPSARTRPPRRWAWLGRLPRSTSIGSSPTGCSTTEFRRLTGRQGPGAGRPAKLYRRAEGELSVSLPARQYDLAAGLLAAAVNDATRTGTPVGEALTRVATQRGRELGDRARARGGEAAEPARPARRRPRSARRAGLRTSRRRQRSRARQLPLPRPRRRTARAGVRHEPRPAVRHGRSRGRRPADRATRAVRGQLLRPPRRQPASTKEVNEERGRVHRDPRAEASC